MKVKICGVTNREDAVWALNDGAQYVGVDFRRKSPRRVLPEEARAWVPDLPTFASVVGLFEDEPPKEIAELAASLNLKGVQMHGPQTPQRLAALGRAMKVTECPPFIVRAMAFPGPESLDDIPRWIEWVDYLLLYDPSEAKPGKSPKPFDWSLAAAAAERGKPVFLAGGLTAENLGQACAQGRPFALDVTASVERSTRRKHRDKMRAFISAAVLGL